MRIVLLGLGFAGRALVARHQATHEFIISSPGGSTVPGAAAVSWAERHDAIDGADAVVLLGWPTIPAESARHPSTELGGLQTVLQLLDVLYRRQSSPHLVFVSSAGAVGRDGSFSSYYGAAKLFGEHALSLYARDTGAPVTVVRPTNFYGPGQSKRPGFGLINTAFECLEQGKPISVYGDGELKRDFFYVDDCADLMHRAISSPDGFRVVELGSGQPQSINEVLESIELVTQMNLERKFLPSRKIDGGDQCADLSWMHEPVVMTSLIEGLQRTWAARQSDDTR